MLAEAGEEEQLGESEESSGAPNVGCAIQIYVYVYMYVYWSSFSFLAALIDFLCCASIARTDNGNRD